MRFRAFITTLLAASLVIATPQTDLSAAGPLGERAESASVSTDSTVDTTVEDDTTRPTVNDFFPEERQLSDCLNSLPKPNCGSDARGGWAQAVVFLAILAALGFIAWRIVAASRRARRDHPRSVTGSV